MIDIVAISVAARLTGANQGLLAVGVLLFFVAIAIAVTLTVLQTTKRGKYSD